MIVVCGTHKGENLVGAKFVGGFDGDDLPGISAERGGAAFQAWEVGEEGGKEGLTIVPVEAEDLAVVPVKGDFDGPDAPVAFISFLLEGLAATFWRPSSSTWDGNAGAKGVCIEVTKSVFRPFVGVGRFEGGAREGQWHTWLKNGEFRLVTFKNDHEEAHAHRAVTVIEGPHKSGEAGYVSPPAVLEVFLMTESELAEVEELKEVVRRGEEEKGEKKRVREDRKPVPVGSGGEEEKEQESEEEEEESVAVSGPRFAERLTNLRKTAGLIGGPPDSGTISAMLAFLEEQLLAEKHPGEPFEARLTRLENKAGS